MKDNTGFFSTLRDSGKTAIPAVTFESDLFHGVSFDLNDASIETVRSIQSLPDVEKIWPAAIFSLPVTGNAVVQEDSLSAWNPHNDTNVARLHASGYLGSDVIVAIVDSGIDYTHPALGGGFGPGYKVEAGYDLVGDDYVLGDAYIPDSDPKDCLGHGTHVAGIIASSNPDLPGVAPSARVRAYKVFGCLDSTMEDVIVNAFLQAYEEGADIINASLGSNQGFPDTPLALVVSKIQAAGVFVAVAAGNSGELGIVC